MAEKKNKLTPSGSPPIGEIKDLICGYSFFHPLFIERFKRINVFLIFVCLLVSTQGVVVSGFVSVFLSTIERRFEMSSVQVSFISVGYDVASIMSLIPVSYYGGRGHKPKWIAAGAVVMGMGSFMFTLPHFIDGPYISKTSKEQKFLCGDDANITMEERIYLKNIYTDDIHAGNAKLKNVTSHCRLKRKSSAAFYLSIMFMANMCHSVGSTPLYTIVISYFDENLPKDMSPLYFAVYYATAMVGPAIGYITGGMLLKIYIDQGRVDTSKLDVSPGDAGWLGAWWVGFLITGSIFFLLAIPISMFPEELPLKHRLKISRLRRKTVSTEEPGNSVVEIMKSLLQNHMYNFINLSGIAEGALIAGFIIFAPKYLEAVYHLPASIAGQLIGIATIPPGCVGMILGGFLVKRFKMGVLQSMRFCQFFIGVAFFLAFGVGLTCPEILYAGVNVPYSNESYFKAGRIQLNNECNEHCECPKYSVNPVCGRNGITYVSPCYAGCTQMNSLEHARLNRETISFENCSCVDGTLTAKHSLTRHHKHSATAGTCKPTCYKLYFFLVLYSSMIFVVFIIWTPILTATIGLVAEKNKSIALAVQWFVVRLFGMVPARIIFGGMIDKACILWRRDECSGAEGSCAIYTTKNLSNFFMVMMLSLKAMSFLSIFSSSYLIQKYVHPSLRSF